ncbi:MAG TPA: cell division protein FtsA [Paludibacteraceae bacterium]|mgnify:FL=1|nr:cell division protein FtsA [Paludibacteraceae bacterium]
MIDLENDDFYVVVDLGTSKVRGAVGIRDKEDNADILCFEQCPSKGVKRGVIVNIEAAAGCVREVVTLLQNRINIIINKNRNDDDKQKFVIEKVYVGLNGQSIRTIDNHVLRNLGNKDVEITSDLLTTLFDENKNVKIDDGEILDVVAQEFNIDDEEEINPVGYLGTRIEGRYKIICGSPSLKTNIENCIQRAGCSVAGYQLAPVAIAKTVLSDEEKNLGCALVDFGAGTTSIVVYYKGILRHLSVVPFGSDVITKDIMDLKVLDKWAEKLKLRGSAMEELTPNCEFEIPVMADKRLRINSRFLASIIEARIDEILDCVWKQLEKSHLTVHINEVVITGNGSRLKFLKEKMEIRTGVDVREGTSTWNVANTEKYQDKTDVKPAQLNKYDYNQLLGLLLDADEACVKTVAEQQVAETVAQRPEKKHVKSDSESGQGSLWNMFKNLKQKTGDLMEDFLEDKNI